MKIEQLTDNERQILVSGLDWLEEQMKKPHPATARETRYTPKEISKVEIVRKKLLVDFAHIIIISMP